MTRLLARGKQTARARAPERGDTLIEVLVAVSILGIAFVAILAGLATAINLSGRQRGHASADVVLVSAADSVRFQTYVSCPTATTASYAPASGVTLPAGWVAGNITITAIKYRNGAIWSTTCPTTDQNVQLLTIRARSTNGLSEESIDVVKRKP